MSARFPYLPPADPALAWPMMSSRLAFSGTGLGVIFDATKDERCRVEVASLGALWVATITGTPPEVALYANYLYSSSFSEEYLDAYHPCSGASRRISTLFSSKFERDRETGKRKCGLGQVDELEAEAEAEADTDTDTDDTCIRYRVSATYLF